MNKVLETIKNSFYFHLSAVLTATSIIYSMSLLTNFSNSFFKISFPPAVKLGVLADYILGFTIIGSFFTLYTFLLWFKDKDIKLSSKIGYSFVISMLFVSSVRFLGYFLQPEVYQRLSNFVLEAVYFSPVILVLISTIEVLTNGKFELLARIGSFSTRWREFLNGWLIIPISCFPAFILEILLLSPLSDNHLIWASIGPIMILLAFSAGEFVYSEDIKSTKQALELLVEEFKKYSDKK